MEQDLSAEAAYQRWAAVYDSMENATRDLDAAVLRRVLEGIEAREVVELGCGTGKNTLWLAERFAHLTALDLSEAMLAKARARCPSDKVRFLRHDLREPLPLPDASADLATIDLVLEHLPEVAPLLGELVEHDGGTVDLAVGLVTFLLVYTDHAVVYSFIARDRHKRPSTDYRPFEQEPAEAPPAD